MASVVNLYQRDDVSMERAMIRMPKVDAELAQSSGDGLIASLALVFVSASGNCFQATSLYS